MLFFFYYRVNDEELYSDDDQLISNKESEIQKEIDEIRNLFSKSSTKILIFKDHSNKKNLKYVLLSASFCN